jgi:hypothetical protein
MKLVGFSLLYIMDSDYILYYIGNGITESRRQVSRAATNILYLVHADKYQELLQIKLVSR